MLRRCGRHPRLDEFRAGGTPWSSSLVPFMVASKGIGRGPEGARDSLTGAAGEMEVGVFVDVDACVVIVVPHHDPRNAAVAIRLEGVPMPMVFAVCAPKHGVSATIRHHGVPDVNECLSGGIADSVYK